MTKINTEGNSIDDFEKTQQLNIRKQLQQLEDNLQKTSSDYIKVLYQRKIDSLKKQLDDSCVPIQTISMEHMKAQQEKLETKQYTFNLTKLKEVLSI